MGTRFWRCITGFIQVTCSIIACRIDQAIFHRSEAIKLTISLVERHPKADDARPYTVQKEHVG